MGEKYRPIEVAMVVLAALVYISTAVVGVRHPEQEKEKRPAALAAEDLEQRAQERFEALKVRLNAFIQMSPEDQQKELRENLGLYLRVMALSLYMMAILVGLFLGIALLIWAAIQKNRGAPLLERDEPAPEEPRWRVWDAIVVFAVMILAGTALSLAAALARVKLALPESIGMWGQIAALLLAEALAAAYAIVIVRARYGQSIAALGFRRRAAGVNLVRGLLGYITVFPLFVAAGYVGTVLFKFFNLKRPVNEAIGFFVEAKSPAELLLLVLVVGLIIPFFEEFLFRGMFYGALRRRIGVTWGIVVSAAVFSLAHRILYQFLPIFVLGMLLAYLYERTRSLVANTFVHAMHNTLSVLLVILILSI